MSKITQVAIHTRQAGQTLPHHWRVCVGGGRVGEALRADFQKHLEMVQRDFPFGYLRMHGLFHEDMMIYRLEAGVPTLNWQYLDLVYDHWLSIGIRPFVEFGFMPYDLASGEETCFWWKGNITPPKDWEQWQWLIEQFLLHVIERYGLDEVRQWYFEVWNEPTLEFFWKGADFAAYMELYARTVASVKKIDSKLRVGGPASAGFGDKPGVPPWGREFLDACAQRSLPVDFFSAHPYPTLYPVDPEGKGYMVWDGPDRLVIDCQGCIDLLQSSAYPTAERHYTEWSSSPSPRDPVHDTAFMAAFLVENNLKVRGMMDSLSFWVVSDIFEECRVGDNPFHGGFGLVNVQGLKKASYHGYWFLAQLGEEILSEGDSFVATRRRDGTIAILAWNYCHYRDDANDSRLLASAKPSEIYELFKMEPATEFTFSLAGLGPSVRVQTTRFDREHGSVYDAWATLGAPSHILPSQLPGLRRAMELDIQSCLVQSGNGNPEYSLIVEPFGVSLLEISPSQEGQA